MNWKPAILRLWKRRETKLVLFGLVLMAMVQWVFIRLNPEGVTLEFVEIVTNGRGMETGTLAKFRLRNKLGQEITYYGQSAHEPNCKIVTYRKNDTADGGSVFAYPYVLVRTNSVNHWSQFAVQDGEEVIVYARVGHAKGPWQLSMDYHYSEDDRDWRHKYVPERFHTWLSIPHVFHPSLMEFRKAVASETVDIKVRGLNHQQRIVLEDYRWALNKAATNRIQTTIVTNADGSFELKQVRIKQAKEHEEKLDETR